MADAAERRRLAVRVSAEAIKPSRTLVATHIVARLVRDGQLVADWVDVLSELVCAGELPAQWPEVLLIDSQNFRIHTGEHAGSGFQVFATMGRAAAEPGRWAAVPRPWRLEPFARKNQAGVGGLLRRARGRTARDRLRRRQRPGVRDRERLRRRWPRASLV